MNDDSFDKRCTWFSVLTQTLESRFGIQPTRHQRQMLFDLVPLLVRESAVDTADHYVELLGHLPLDNTLVQNIVRALTVKESYFFRDPSTMESLRTRILPELLAKVRDSKVLRVWSAGCSTGEELYTIAVLLDEMLPDRHGFTIRLVGTDIDTQAIERARAGVYGAWSLRATMPSDVTRVFDRLAHGYRIKDTFRANTAFEIHNLSDPLALVPSPGEFDLIFCRNVSIYFVGEAITGLHTKLRNALAPHGFWVAAPSDPIPAAGWDTAVLPGMLFHQRERKVVPLASRISPPPEPQRAAGTSGASRNPAQRSPIPNQVSFAMTATRPQPAPVPIASTSTAARAVASDGVQPERIARVLQHADDGHVADALIKAEALAAEYPLNANVHRLVALLFEDAKKLEEALLAWRRVLYLAPDDVDAHLRVGLLLGRMGDRAGATRALRNAVVARERRKLRNEHSKAAGQTVESDDTVDVAGSLLRKIRGGAS